MTFTDEDLARLKEVIYMAKQADGKVSFPKVEKIEALLARLEAGDALAKACENHYSMNDLHAAYEVWRKAAGK